MDSTAVSSTLNSALSLNVTAVNSSSSSSSGAQLTNYTLTTAVVDNQTAVLSGDFSASLDAPPANSASSVRILQIGCTAYQAATSMKLYMPLAFICIALKF